MRAVVAHGPGDLRLEERPDPAAGPGEVAIRVRYGGICGSDLHYWRHGAVGDFRLREPLVLGHEVAGVVQSVGDGVEVPVGTSVVVHPATPCQACGFCADGRANLCPETGYLGSAARFPHVQGGFSDTLVMPATHVRPLPAGLDLRRAAVAEPAAVAVHAVRKAGDVLGKRVLVTGAGPIGCLVVAALRMAGAGEIVVTDLHELPLSVAGAVGGTRLVRIGDPDAEKLDFLGADVAIESSGSPAGFDTCVRAVVRGGSIVALGMTPPGPSPVAVNMMIARELSVTGSFRFTTELDDVVAALADGSLAADPVVTAVLPVSLLHEAFELAGDPVRSCKVLLDFS